MTIYQLLFVALILAVTVPTFYRSASRFYLRHTARQRSLRAGQRVALKQRMRKPRR
jgi:hypothetical protein